MLRRNRNRAGRDHARWPKLLGVALFLYGSPQPDGWTEGVEVPG